ncbi:uncharacterized protein LOC134274431, partial [Saccostrea cucullata]|uniref:uncharacterized protein LOC134274431 n=1 Tax=Saccostrea cuccullata TaxID=36930 RepID=UPI002ED2811D
TTEMNTGFQSTKQHQTSSFENLPQDSGGAVATVGIVLALLILVVVVVVVPVVFYRRNTCGFKDKMELLFNYIRNHLLRNTETETRPSGRTDEEAGATDETKNPLLPGYEAEVNGSEKQKQ